VKRPAVCTQKARGHAQASQNRLIFLKLFNRRWFNWSRISPSWTTPR